VPPSGQRNHALDSNAILTIPHLAPGEAAATAVDSHTEGGTRSTAHKVVAQRAAAAAAGYWAAIAAASLSCCPVLAAAAAAPQEFGCVLELVTGDTSAQLTTVIGTPRRQQALRNRDTKNQARLSWSCVFVHHHQLHCLNVCIQAHSGPKPCTHACGLEITLQTTP
jgi:hypothetical protein